MLSLDHTAGCGPDKLGAVWGHFLKWHFLMLLVVTSSGRGNPYCHGFPLGSTLSVNQCCPVTSLPRRPEPLCATHSEGRGPDLQGPMGGPVRAWPYLWLSRGVLDYRGEAGSPQPGAGRTLSMVQMSFQQVLRTPEAQTGRY